MIRRYRWSLVTLAAIALAVAALLEVAPIGAAAAAGPAEPAANSIMYLPVLLRAPGSIYGRVTEGGNNVASVTLSLKLYNGSAWSTVVTTTTDAGGRYQFLNMNPLAANQRYQVTFENTAGSDARLAWWSTREVTSYNRGEMVAIGNFDIGAVSLAQPDPNQGVVLPALFRWNRRAPTSDSYAVRLYDPSDLNPFFVSAYVGYADNYTLTGLPGGFGAGVAYTWDVAVRSPDGGNGASRQTRTVLMFGSGAIYGRVTQGGNGVGGLLLQLRFFNGSVWSTAATISTNGDGTYQFYNVGTLGTNQQYYVRYENAAQTEGRVFQWSTRSLTSYSAGSAVGIGDFDIADVALVDPAGGAAVTLPAVFRWTRRPATPTDSYILEIYDPADRNPRWLSPLLGYVESTTLTGLSTGLAINTQYAWDVVIYSPDGGSGVSRIARLLRFNNTGLPTSAQGELTLVDEPSNWPFPEAMPARPAESYEGGQ